MIHPLMVLDWETAKSRHSGSNWEDEETALNGLKRMETGRCLKEDICESHCCVDDAVEWDLIGQDLEKSSVQIAEPL